MTEPKTPQKKAAPFNPIPQGEVPEFRPTASEGEVSHDAMMVQHMGQQLEELQIIVKTLERTLNKRSQELFEVEVQNTRLESEKKSLQHQLEMQRQLNVDSSPTSESQAPEAESAPEPETKE